MNVHFVNRDHHDTCEEYTTRMLHTQKMCSVFILLTAEKVFGFQYMYITLNGMTKKSNTVCLCALCECHNRKCYSIKTKHFSIVFIFYLISSSDDNLKSIDSYLLICQIELSFTQCSLKKKLLFVFMEKKLELNVVCMFFFLLCSVAHLFFCCCFFIN